MRTLMVRVILCAALVVGIWRAWAEEDSGPVRELPAGTEMADGTVAGEVQALNYFKTKEPELYKKLRDLEPETMRRIYGKYFMWFQRVGNYRKQQKREMIRQIKDDLQIHDLYDELRKTQNAAAKAELKAKMKKSVEDLFDSDLWLLEYQLEGQKQSLDEIKREVEQMAQRISERRKSKTEVIERRMKELTKQD
ncbi:MAG: hypothetical protein HY611_02290 [Elusimicrobia bacterium]|nr:hypothetical protein [Elusimicrobiota bacterium]